MANEPTCRICYGPGEYFCIFCAHSYFCKQHVCAHIGKVTDDPPPTRTEMTREEFTRHTFQQFVDKTPEEIAEQKDKRTSRQIRVFLVLGVPGGLVVAFVIAMAQNLGDSGFFCCWAIFAVLIGFFADSYIEAKQKPPDG